MPSQTTTTDQTEQDHSVPDAAASIDGTTSAVIGVVELGSQWPTLDPFLFCAHHDDDYPNGNGKLGPAADLSGRDIGSDFSGRDGFSMYHGEEVPGFPSHPHRGFETVTFVRKGLIDHADSLGATARFGRGDVQWLTAGAGIQHSEMFPLVNNDSNNPLELFQIWLNLPASDKFVDPYFTMFWDEDIPQVSQVDEADRHSVVTVIAGSFGGITALDPPPNSWASRDQADLAILHLALEPGASINIPAANLGASTNRVLYLFEGETLIVDDVTIANDHAAQVRGDRDIRLTAGASPVEVLLLQGAPIGEPVAKYGPFVMNTEEEIRQTFEQYRRTEFGGWPWDSSDPNHGSERGRFAVHVDGRLDEPT